MDKRLLLLLPALSLAACDSSPAAASDTDDAPTTTGTSSTAETETPEPSTSGTTAATTDSPPTDDSSTTGVDETGGGSDTTDGETTTGGPDTLGTTSDASTGDEGMESTGGVEPFCGDGRVDPEEACDDGDANGTYGACDAECQGPGPQCGDGNVDAPQEQCDDGEDNGAYGMCADDCGGPGPSCGDGVITPPHEECDDGEDNGSYGQCASTCDGPAAFCGDGNVDAPFEICDDGDALNGNGCNNDCQPSGEVLFEITKTTIGTTSSDAGVGVAVHDDGTVLVAQRSRLDDDVQQAIAVEFDEDGSLLSEQIHQNNTPDTRNIEIRSLQSTGDYLLFDSPVGASGQTLVVAYDADHDQQWLLAAESQRDLELMPGGGSVGVYAPPSEPSLFRFRDETGELDFESSQNAAYSYWNAEPYDDDSAMMLQFVDVGAGLQPTLARVQSSGAVVTQVIHSDISIDTWQYGRLAIGPAGHTAVASDGSVSLDGAYVAVFDTDGSRVWETNYEDPDGGRLYVRDVALDSDGAVVVVGSVADTAFPFQQDGLVMKFAAGGDLLWRRDFAGLAGESESIRSVAVAPGDSIYATGTLRNIPSAPDLLLVRISP